MTSLRWILVIAFVGILALLSTLGISVSLFGKSVAQSSPSVTMDNPQLNPDIPEPTEAEIRAGSVPPPPKEALGDMPIGDGSTSPASSMTSPPQDAGDGFIPSELPPLPADAYVYQKEGKRDPFEPFRRVRAAMAGGTQAAEDISALERWEIDKIKIIAVLWDTKNPRAVVMTPDAATHTVSRGTKIGRNFGVIKDIREGEIVVAEKIFIDGKSKTEIQVIELK